MILAEALDTTLFLGMIRVTSNCVLAGNFVPVAKVAIMLGSEMIDFPMEAVVGNSTNNLPRLTS